MRNFDPKAVPGRKIILHSMPDDLSKNPIPPETEGTIKDVDGIGQIMVDWHEECTECFGDGTVGRRECEKCSGDGTISLGRSLSVIPGVDDYTILENKYIKKMKRIKKYNEFFLKEALKQEIEEHMSDLVGSYDQEELDNVIEIANEYDNDLTGLNKTDKTLILRMIDDEELYDKIDAIGNSNEDPFADDPFK